MGFQNEEEAWRSKMRRRIGARGVHVEEEREKGGKTTITVAQYELIMQQLIAHDPIDRHGNDSTASFASFLV